MKLLPSAQNKNLFHQKTIFFFGCSYNQKTMSKGKLWGIILFILIVLGFGIWLYTSSNVKKDVDKEGIEILDDMTIPAVN